MHDPLDGFDWTTIHKQYDRKCERFKPNSPHLRYFGVARPQSDRELYYQLLRMYIPGQRKAETDLTGAYECMMYWKYYSQGTCTHNILNLGERGTDIRTQAESRLREAIELLPEKIEKTVASVMGWVKKLSKCKLPCAGGCNLPTQTTFLHFLYPNVVPIFDAKVLEAIGVVGKQNHSLGVLKKYIPFAWGLAKKYEAVSASNASDCQETPLRRIDMALWVHRGVSSGLAQSLPVRDIPF